MPRTTALADAPAHAPDSTGPLASTPVLPAACFRGRVHSRSSAAKTTAPCYASSVSACPMTAQAAQPTAMRSSPVRPSSKALISMAVCMWLQNLRIVSPLVLEAGTRFQAVCVPFAARHDEQEKARRKNARRASRRSSGKERFRRRPPHNGRSRQREWPAAGGGRGAFGLALQEPVQLFAERKARIGPGCDLANALPGRKRTVSESGAVCALRPFTARRWTGAKRPAFAVPSGSRQQGGRGSETGANPGGLKRLLRPFH